MEALSAQGRRCVAPDLYCLGDSKDPGPATFERNLAALSARIDRTNELLQRMLAEVAKTYGTPRRTVLLESAGQTVSAAVPLEVADYIRRHGLYSEGVTERSA